MVPRISTSAAETLRRAKPKRGRSRQILRLYESSKYGAIELGGVKWKCAWDFSDDKVNCVTIQHLPADLELAIEALCASLKKHGHYCRAIMVHSPRAADTLEEMLALTK